MFAIIPAAGHSQRMGAPKLLLPWGDRTVIDHLLEIWKLSSVCRIVIVIRADDEALQSVCRCHDVDIVLPSKAPIDMKQSVIHGLNHLSEQYAPDSSASWLLAPADMPTLKVDVIERLIDARNKFPQSILVPTFDNQPGHPVLIPWSLASRVSRLPKNEGVNALIKRSNRQPIAMPPHHRPEDLDTPADYQRLQPRRQDDES
ncbi:MAG: nucleotidyltransferase family protein [Planctomycetaceae bacterium]|nr:nucleotidyltransferase family protein [Planctomycetaceae bacterium]